MGSSESKESGSRLQNATIGRAGDSFPTELNLYFETLSTKLKLNLGEHKDQPMSVLSLPDGWWGDMILYSSTDTKSDPLAVVRAAGKLSKHDAVEVAPIKLGGPVIREQMEVASRGWTGASYTFQAPVEGGRNETFEWRNSKSAEVRELGESHNGWELVRMDGRGDEVVAVWAEVKLKLALSKTASFRFVGRGARGELGPIWAIMAVTTFLRIWQKRMQIYMRGGIAAGASSSVAGAAAIS